MAAPAEVVSVIRHEVRPGSEAAYEAWTKEVLPIAQAFPGHQGVAIIRPPQGSRLYTIVLHFDGIEHLRGWLDSDVRHRLLARVEPHLAKDTEVEIRPGLEVWLPPPGQKPARPAKQFLLVWAVIYPLTLAVGWIMGPLSAAVPAFETLWLRSLAVSLFLVGTMTYVIMPPLTRAVSGWLYR